MNEDYLKFWGVTKPPFSLTPDPDMLYPSSQHAECLMRLKYAIFSQKGGALLVSDNPGSGKTSILAKLKKDLNEYYSGRVKVVFIDHPTLTPIEMIGEIGHQLGTELHTTEKIRALNSLRDRLFTFYNENVKIIVIVDEGQMLMERLDLLGELRILLNFCVSDSFLLTFIFSGQKPLDDILRGMPEFWQRLPVRFFLKNLNFNDTRELIRFRLKKVGVTDEIFNNDAYTGIYNYSEGCPRVICSIADLCLVIGYARGVKRIGFVEVSTACRDMETSGDGFHYYSYLKSQQYDLFSRPGAEPVTPLEKSPGKAKGKPGESGTAIPVGEAITCPRCGERNRKKVTYCTACGSPLYKKCPKCLTLLETTVTECPVCHADTKAESNRLQDEVRRYLRDFDILAGGYDIWLRTKKIELHDDEKVLIIFPRGNILSPGPKAIDLLKSDSPGKEDCDIILTDSRLILCIGDRITSTELHRIGDCTVSETGKFLGHRYNLTVYLADGKFKLILPYGSEKSKKVMNSISLYIKSVMLT